MATYSNSAREVEMPNGDVVVLHNAVTANTTSNIKKFKYDDNGHVTESDAADAEDLNLSSYSTPTTGTTAIGTSDDIQTAIGKLDHQSQIDQSNILYALNTGVKNLFPINNGTPSAAYLNKNGASGEDLTHSIPAGTYILLWTVSSAVSNCGFQFILGNGDLTTTANRIVTTTRYASNETVTYTDEVVIPTGKTATTFVFYVNAAGSVANVMLCPKAIYEQDPSYVPYALPNYDLTYLQAEDRASLAEVVDSGAKNVFDFANCGNGNWHATTSKTDTSFTITSTDTRAYFSMWQSLPAGHYVFSAKISNRSGPDYTGIVIRANGTSGENLGPVINFSANGTITGEFTCTATTNVYFVCYASMDTFTSATTYTASEIMICTKAAFGVSSKFVPYRPNWDLVGTIALQNYPKVIDPCDFNTLVDTGYYIVDQSGSTNLPWSHGEKIFLRVIRFAPGNSQNVMQIGWSFNNAAAEYCVRSRYLGTWGSWYSYKGTALS